MWFRELVRTLHDRRAKLLVIVDAAGRAVGTVTEGDLLLKLTRHAIEDRAEAPESAARRAERRKAAGVTARDLMSAPLVSIAAGELALDAARLMRRRRVRHLAVLDPEGFPLGVLDRHDLLTVLVRPDREIEQDVEDLLAAELHQPAAGVEARVRGGVAELTCRAGFEGSLDRLLPDLGEIEGLVAVRMRGGAGAAPGVLSGAGPLAGQVMTRPAVVASPDTAIPEAAGLMHRHGVTRLPVVDATGHVVGIVSRGDLLRVFLGTDEELRDRVFETCGEDLASVTLTIEDGVVTLRAAGVVPGPARRIVRAVEAVAGVVAVRNELGAAPAVALETRRSTVNAPAAEIETLSEEQCLELLRSHSLGRIALNDHGQPLIFPVNYAADDRAVVFRTAPGMKLQEAPMTQVAFEIDEVDAAAGRAWSVLVKGVAYNITWTLDDLSERLRELVVRPMAPGEHPNWVAIRRQEISGRRFRLQPVD
jgi:CBS domain-containing protein/nitroimidazol reductase NimA-like FMN-containing flavoprotein (pyridoxamine 5'-phosphate oxidase superfamily)